MAKRERPSLLDALSLAIWKDDSQAPLPDPDEVARIHAELIAKWEAEEDDG